VRHHAKAWMMSPTRTSGWHGVPSLFSDILPHTHGVADEVVDHEIGAQAAKHAVSSSAAQVERREHLSAKLTPTVRRAPWTRRPVRKAASLSG
jgi:hypothetical protein